MAGSGEQEMNANLDSKLGQSSSQAPTAAGDFNPKILIGLEVPIWMKDLISLKPPFGIYSQHDKILDVFCIDCSKTLCAGCLGECRPKHDTYQVLLLPESDRLAIHSENVSPILEAAHIKKLKDMVLIVNHEKQGYVYLVPSSKKEKRKRESFACYGCGVMMSKKTKFCSLGCIVAGIDKANSGLPSGMGTTFSTGVSLSQVAHGVSDAPTGTGADTGTELKRASTGADTGTDFSDGAEANAVAGGASDTGNLGGVSSSMADQP